MNAQNAASARTAWQLGDRVKVWIGPAKRGYWLRGIVAGIDDGPMPGVRVEDGGPGCYATHAEVVRDEQMYEASGVAPPPDAAAVAVSSLPDPLGETGVA